MRTYELVHRDAQEGVRVYTAKFRDAERVMTDAELQPYEGEARGSKYLTGARLLPTDAHQVMVHTQGSWEFEQLRITLGALWPTKPPAHTASSRDDRRSGKGGRRDQQQRRQREGGFQRRNRPVNVAEGEQPPEDDSNVPEEPLEPLPAEHFEDAEQEVYENNAEGNDVQDFEDDEGQYDDEELLDPDLEDENPSTELKGQITDIFDALSATAKRLQQFTQGRGWTDRFPDRARGRKRDKGRGSGTRGRGSAGTSPGSAAPPRGADGRFHLRGGQSGTGSVAPERTADPTPNERTTTHWPNVPYPSSSPFRRGQSYKRKEVFFNESANDYEAYVVSVDLEDSDPYIGMVCSTCETPSIDNPQLLECGHCQEVTCSTCLRGDHHCGLEVGSAELDVGFLSQFQHEVNMVPRSVSTNVPRLPEEDPGVFMVIDTACMRMVEGSETRANREEKLRRNGLNLVWNDENEKFKFGVSLEISRRRNSSISTSTRLREHSSYIRQRPG